MSTSSVLKIVKPRITKQVAEGIAQEFLLNVPAGLIAQKWKFSRQTLNVIRRGDHPALSRETRLQLFKWSSRKQKRKILNRPEMTPRIDPKPDIAAIAGQNLVLRTMLLDLFDDMLKRVHFIQKACG